jgi:hypothetical protein
MGSSFSAPWFVTTLSGTLAPLPYSFLELGLDYGMISGEVDVGFYSISPFARYAIFLPLKPGGLFVGAGGSYTISEFEFPEKKLPVNIFAFDAGGGFRFNNGIGISYTLRTNFSNVSNTLLIGYSYRFK